MVKNAKKAPVNHGKQITAFFARSTKAPPASASQDASSSSRENRSLSISSRIENREHITTNAKSPLNGLKSARSPTIAREPASSKSTESTRETTEAIPQTTLIPSSSVSSLKRSRSPDAHSLRPSTPTSSYNNRPSEAFKTPERRKSKFDSDSEVETSNTVIYVKSTPNPQRRKKARLSSPGEYSKSCTSDLVPSSQSDEEELASTQMGPKLSSTTLGDQQKQTLPPTPDQDGDGFMAMKVDAPPVSMPASDPPTTNLQIRGDNHSFGQILTPPLSDVPSVPPTPIALDQASKTAKIIADIKARAYAKSLSSPEVASLEFDDHLNSSDDDEFLPVQPLVAMKSASSNSKDRQKDEAAGTSRRSTRYSLRNRSPSPSNGSRSRKSANQASQERTKKKILSIDPFEALLKEKKLAEKRGNGDDAIHRAELTASKFGRNSLVNEMDEEEDEEDTNEWNSGGLSTLVMRQTTRSSSQDIDLAVEDRQKLFGEGGGKSIMDILQRDKVAKRQADLSEKISGIQLWSAMPIAQDTAMGVDGAAYQFPGNSPIIHLLNAFLHRDDISRAAMLLKMNLILAVCSAERADFASCLCDLALSSRFAIVGEPASRTLENFWSSSTQPLMSTITFANILTCIESIGAQHSVLNSQHWAVSNAMDPRNVDASNRDAILHRLIILVTSCARSRRLHVEEIPDIVLALMLIGMDSAASQDLLQDIIQVVDTVCHCISSDSSVSTQIEMALCSKVLNCVTPYEPINKLRMLSFLSSGSGCTRRVANYVAYCIIIEKNSPMLEMYSDAPPLSDVLEQLIPYSRSTSLPPGKFALHDHTDYVDLGFYITILSVAVSNLKSYVALERQFSQQKMPSSYLSESPSKLLEKPKTNLQLLHMALETLHAGISDTRATHLERSRTKAGIKGLAMNIHYQREIWLRNKPNAKSKTLAQYFKKKS